MSGEHHNRLQGKSVIVTGGSRGIGFATAQEFLRAGARVAICAIKQKNLRESEAQLGAGDRLLARVADVADPVQVRAFVEDAAAVFGPVDVLVNNAGVLHVGSFAEERFESIESVIDVNLKGLMYMTRAVLPSMITRREGVIVNVSSGAGLTGFPDIVSYCASKFGVVGFTEALNQEVRNQGLRVYALCPGRVATDMQAQYSGTKIGMAPEKIARRILELATGKPSLLPERCVVTVG
jgi:3-oxoacyl-[acyl-carrier protein] reductase